MSRQRTFLTADFRRLRSDVPVFQATDSEIQSDLVKLKYEKKIEPEVEVIKQELPKKRKAPVDEDKFVIDGLVKLMSTKAPEVKKKAEAPVEKKAEVTAEKKVEVQNRPQNLNPNLMSYLMLHNQYLMRGGYYMPQQFGMIPYISYSSSADKHLRIAKLIQSQKGKKQ